VHLGFLVTGLSHFFIVATNSLQRIDLIPAMNAGGQVDHAKASFGYWVSAHSYLHARIQQQDFPRPLIPQTLKPCNDGMNPLGNVLL
jgi:hypothetical protein